MSVQYGRKCFLCNNTRHRNKQCRLFRFPARGSPMWGKWLAALGLTDADIDVNSNAPPRLCHQHFEPKDFLQRKLSAMAVPKRYEQSREMKKQKDVVGSGDTPQTSGLVQTMQRTKDDNLSAVQLDGGQDSEPETDHYVENETLSNCVEDAFETESYEYQSWYYAPVLDATVEESASDLGTPILSSPPECYVPQHETLMKQLEVERARVKELLQENAQQRHIIEDQRNLLMQLGVQYTTFDAAEGDS